MHSFKIGPKPLGSCELYGTSTEEIAPHTLNINSPIKALNHPVTLTIWIVGKNSFVRFNWLAESQLVLRTHSELVLLARLKTFYNVRFCGWSSRNGFPEVTAFFRLLNSVTYIIK